MRASRSHGGLREHFLVRIIFQDWKESQSRKIKKLLFGLLLRNHHDRSYFLFVLRCNQPDHSWLRCLFTRPSDGL